ncbi:alpha-ketoglutarate-dependent dioxygenase AlkB [Candidimonas sp. SYP-B2681]|uniref:alpha-ketoglutarate-dependent dioxygenase AlkB n=1 Tax=Candidimonas sp. SYP-B2681 TaxID=2497686 RepID=UPI000F88CF2C|nr:alpha-ketoglutarate-dependent dioxygenase AlkB [Candidimonas sp. SYP-B2681]RTZ44621.1 alpha-ketoglutarate-dependent dioxygenase AlkB [Candidimonas sp. SYP-B2681]
METGTSSLQTNLFDDLPIVQPAGLRYQDNFLSPKEEQALIDVIRTLPLSEMQYKAYTAKRRILSFEGQYDFSDNTLRPSPACPDFLKPLRARVADWAHVSPEQIRQILIAEYQTGTPLGWHRDVPDFEDIIGVSLQGEAVLRFRPYPPMQPSKADIIKLTLLPRSIYVLRGPARWAWQHSVAPTRSLRYSITFRTISP